MFRPCVLIPTYNNAATIRRVVQGAKVHLDPVIVVDDGSDAEARQACAQLQHDGLAHVVHREANGGKGAAVKDGFREALRLGYTHAFQIDGDAQHDLQVMPHFLAQAHAHPDALVLGTPSYDDTLHKGRYAARLVTRFWNTIETLGTSIGDSMCGYRVYPLQAALDAGTRGDRMDFDIEIPVRMVWQGVPVVNLPVGVRYLTEEEGGISHYRVLEDTIRISWTHTRLVFEGVLVLIRAIGRRLGGRP